MGAIELRDYQKEGVRFLREKRMAILADEPGLGKTFTALEAALETSGPEGYILAVVPAHLMYQWYEQAKLYKPDLFVRLVYRHDPDSWEPGLYILSYPSIQDAGRRSLTWVWETHWHAIIADEAHRMRSRKSQQFKNFKDLWSEHQFLLTGSPLENNPADIWALLHLCNRKDFRSYWKFVQYWCEVDRNPWQTKPTKVYEWLEDDFRGMLDQYMIRRLKTDELDLPEVIHDVRFVDLDPTVMALHREAKKNFRIEHESLSEPQLILAAGALVPALRQLTGAPPKGLKNAKADMVREIISDLPEEPVIIFAWHKMCAGEFVNNIPGRNTYLITGDVGQEAREDILECWRGDPTGVLIGTISSIGEGMNLQHAATAFFYEHPYLPGQLEQALSRVQRIGQTRDRILAYHIIGRGTIDASVYKVVTKRRDNINAALREFLEEDE